MEAILRRPTMLMRSRSSSSSVHRCVRAAYCLTAVFVLKQSISAPIEIMCPTEVPATAVQVRVPSVDWVAFIDNPAKLVGANASAGPPGSFATLVGEPSVRATANVHSVKYRFEREYLHNDNWIECIYGDRPEISLFQQLPHDVSECTIETRRSNKSESAQVRITCKSE